MRTITMSLAITAMSLLTAGHNPALARGLELSGSSGDVARCLHIDQYAARVSEAVGNGKYGCVRASNIVPSWGGTACLEVITQVQVNVWGGGQPNQTITNNVYVNDLRSINWDTEGYLLNKVGLPACWGGGQ